MRPMRALLILPTFQEALNIIEVLDRVRAATPDVHILVVDDGSPDGTADLAIGSRYVPGGRTESWSWRRRWLSRWGNRYAAGVLGLAVNDSTAGYRAYRATMLCQIDLDGVAADGYGFQIEMTYEVVRRGGSVVEVPIAFADRLRGTSKMSSRIVVEALALVTWWGLRDRLLRRRP